MTVRPHRLIASLTSVLLLATAGMALAQPRPQKITLAAVAEARDVDVGVNVLRAAYGRLGIEIEVQRHAGEIALQKSNSGEVAGEVHRIDGIRERYPNLVQVPVPISYLDIAVFSKKPDFRPSAWRDLAPLRVGIVRGVVALEGATRGLKTRQVDTYAELFPLLLRGEVDAVAAPVVVALDWLRRSQASPESLGATVLDSYLLYHYLHKSHAFLIPQVEPILRQMLRDGTIARIRAETYADLAAPRQALRP